MSKHTTGPWKVNDEGNVIAVTDTSVTEIAKTGYHSFEPSTQKNIQANARLIAAAPELLEFLKSFVAGETMAENIEGYIAAVVSGAKQLIAKAEGGAE